MLRLFSREKLTDPQSQVRKGEHLTAIFFTKRPFEVEDDGREMILVLKHYAVFHTSQVDSVPASKAPTIEEAR
jgi:antirestriction protein ArdC